jgi:hypothetical protein
MKNLLTLIALFVSTSGILISLAREEVRCYLGLESLKCGASRQESPQRVSPSPARVEQVRVKETPLPASQPLEVIPAPETEQSVSIPLEVIPAPEE